MFTPWKSPVSENSAFMLKLTVLLLYQTDTHILMLTL